MDFLFSTCYCLICMQLTKKQMADITEILKRHPIKAAYLFGSQSTGKTGPLSDVDIGVLLKGRPSQISRAKILTDVFIDLARMLHTDLIDLIDLEDAPVLLCYNITMKGRLLFTNDQADTNRFVFHALQQFEDFRFHLDTQQRLIKQRLLA